MKKSDFRSRLKDAMNIRGIKAVDLVERTGFGKSKISQYMNGVYEPKPDALFTIAKALDVDEGWLMGYDCPMDKKLNIECKKEVSREEQVMEAVKTVFGSQAHTLLYDFLTMNPDGRSKLAGYAKDLLENPKNTEEKKGTLIKRIGNIIYVKF